MATTSQTTRHTNTILKISARAFTNPFLASSKEGKNGGNPVTVFHFPPASSSPSIQSSSHQFIPSPKLRSHLAQTCKWESVFTYSGYKVGQEEDGNEVEDPNKTKNNNRIWFHMPSGEEVSFCAHAAMAACSVLQNEFMKEKIDENVEESTNKIQFFSGLIEEENEEKNVTKDILQQNVTTVENVIYKSNDQHEELRLSEVTLQMPSALSEEEVDYEKTLQLLHQVGLSKEDVMMEQSANIIPSFINSSVARNKTLIPLKSTSILNSAINPKDELLFRDLCDEIHSTGLYLYTPLSSLSYECRQFPRFSGYPEDPATGIAAAALANSLFERRRRRRRSVNADDNDGKNTVVYEMFQGNAMKKPSRIKICIDSNEESDDLSCSGIVEVDELVEISI